MVTRADFWMSAAIWERRFFFSWHILEIFALPENERDVYYAWKRDERTLPQSEQDVNFASMLDKWTRYEAMRVQLVPTLVIYAYSTVLVMWGTACEQRFVRVLPKWNSTYCCWAHFSSWSVIARWGSYHLAVWWWGVKTTVCWCEFRPQW